MTLFAPLLVRLPQEAPDFVSSLSMKVEIEQKKANVNPVLDQFSTSAWEFFVSDVSQPTGVGAMGDFKHSCNFF